MGKILKALQTANGDISDLVMQCLEDIPDAPSSRLANGRRGGKAAVVEGIFESAAVARAAGRDGHRENHERLEPWAEELAGRNVATAAAPELGTRRISFRVSDASPLLSPAKEDRRAAEQYRMIRTRIFHHLPGSSITVISSPGMGDGKTVTAVNLAAALAHKSEDKVLLIDADLRLSKVHHRLGLEKGPGLANILEGSCTLEDAMLQVEQLPNFFVLPAGESTVNPTELLDSSAWHALLSRLRSDFRRTIVDSPPVEAVADFDLISPHCDGVVLVVRPDHTSRAVLTSALAKLKGKLTGVLMNDVEDWFLWKRETPSYRYYQNGGQSKATR